MTMIFHLIFKNKGAQQFKKLANKIKELEYVYKEDKNTFKMTKLSKNKNCKYEMNFKIWRMIIKTKLKKCKKMKSMNKIILIRQIILKQMSIAQKAKGENLIVQKQLSKMSKNMKVKINKAVQN